MKPLIEAHFVYRDAVQSLMGTNPSAQEILDAASNIHKIGTSTIQTGGGTFFDIFAKKGRNEWEEVEKIITHFKEKGVRQSALVRGDCLFSYKPQPFDVVEALVREYGKMGMNVLQNFHGLNDTDATAAVARAVHIAREEDGSDIEAWGTLCVEDNANVTIDSCLRAAEKLKEQGHVAFYIKSASGRLNPDFGYKLVGALVDNFGEMPIHMHAHTTYGEAAAFYMAGIEAAIERNHQIGYDVQHPALAGSTAHPSMQKMNSLLHVHPNKAIRENKPVLDFDAIQADMDSLAMFRFRYRGAESPYDHDLLESMRAARAPGGASSTLRAIPGLEANLSRLLGTTDWNEVQVAIYKMQAEILPDLGDPTQVTPYALMTTNQAAMSLFNVLSGEDKYARLHPDAQGYLYGKLGALPESTSPDLIFKVQGRHKAGKDYIPAADLPPLMGEMKKQLQDAGIKTPDARQMVSAALLKDGVKHVVDCVKGRNKPATPPALPDYAIVPEDLDGEFGHGGAPRIKVKTGAHIVAALGGIPKLEIMAQKALFLKILDDGLNIFPADSETKKRGEWHAKLVRQLGEFFQDIPAKLLDADFTEFRSEYEGSLRRAFRMSSVQDILTDIFDAKGHGLFAHALDETHIKLIPDIVPVANNDQDEKDPAHSATNGRH